MSARSSSKRLKIGFVVDDTLDKPDGVQQYVLSLGVWLSGQGHEVHYLAGASKRQDVPHVHSLSRNISVKFNGNKLSIPLPADRTRIARLLQREQYDILHVQLPYSPMLAHKIIALAGPKTAVVGTFHILPHGRLAAVGTHVLGRWTASTLKRFDKIVAVSAAAKQFAEQAFRLHDIQVLPNVVDTAVYRTAKPHAFDGNETVIMFLGRLVPRKGCATLVEAAALLPQLTAQPFRVVVCGRGALEPELKAQVKRLGIADKVSFEGFIAEADKPGYMKASDVLVFPSLGGESFGIVLIEGMAARHPLVLAGDNPGYRTVMHDRPELLFAPGDATGLAKKLAHFLDDATARQAAVEWQKQHVGQFDVAVVGSQLEEIYGQLLAKLHAPS